MATDKSENSIQENKTELKIDTEPNADTPVSAESAMKPEPEVPDKPAPTPKVSAEKSPDPEPTQMIVDAVVPVKLKPEIIEKTPPQSSTPWTLQQFFNGEIDLDVELTKRFANMPVLSSIRFRKLGVQTGRGVATLSSSDDAARLVIDADPVSKEVQLSFTYGSMITLRFTLDDLSDMDRSRWIELMRRKEGGLAFLWGPTRWQNDYVICVSRQYFTNLYAFSPRNFEAALRMTPVVLEQLLDWLDNIWKQSSKQEDEPPLLTW